MSSAKDGLSTLTSKDEAFSKLTKVLPSKDEAFRMLKKALPDKKG
jgi:hypothetical protein